MVYPWCVHFSVQLKHQFVEKEVQLISSPFGLPENEKSSSHGIFAQQKEKQNSETCVPNSVYMNKFHVATSSMCSNKSCLSPQTTQTNDELKLIVEQNKAIQTKHQPIFGQSTNSIIEQSIPSLTQHQGMNGEGSIKCSYCKL